MRLPPERSDARDAAIDALLPVAATHGFGAPALRQAAGPQADLLFPGGPTDVIEAWIDLTDRRMAATAALDGLGLTKRVRALVATRLELLQPYKPAVRRAAALLALPHNAPVAARCTARTVDAIWVGAGDTSADFNWYTKRAILAGVYTSTLFYWLQDKTTLEQALAFLDRRLAGVGKIGKLKARLKAA
jgi:ubiquinone biosynthesis protein COQ9